MADEFYVFPDDFGWKSLSQFALDQHVSIGHEQDVLRIVRAQPSLSSDDRNRLIHGLRSSIRTINSAVSNIKEGYRFDDEFADRKVAAINQAVAHLESHAALLESIYQPSRIHSD